MREAPIVRQIQLAVTSLAGRCFRNTVAKCVLGKAERMPRDGAVFLYRGDVVVRQGRITAVGVVGSGDLLGWRQVRITQEMVGREFAQFLSIEVKRPGKSHTSPEQKTWLEVTTRAGACAGIVTSIAEAETLLRSPP